MEIKGTTAEMLSNYFKGRYRTLSNSINSIRNGLGLELILKEEGFRASTNVSLDCLGIGSLYRQNHR